MSTTIITRPKVDIATSLLEDIQTQVHEVGQVVIHVLYSVPPGEYSSLIRIWPTTFLYDQGSEYKSEMVHAENITYYPKWYECIPGSTNFFSLIFKGLPKSCSTFDLIEHCTNQSGAFEVHGIQRNDTDVYYVRIS